MDVAVTIGVVSAPHVSRSLPTAPRSAILTICQTDRFRPSRHLSVGFSASLLAGRTQRGYLLRGCLETAMGGLNPDNSMESERSPIPGAFDVDPRDPGRA